MIAKRAAGLYYSGKRRREWLKFKAVHEQEVVIVGYTEPRRSRQYFGSLVLAVRDKAKKRWVYAGHVGTGFDRAALKSLYGMMQPLRTDKQHLDQKVKDENATTGWLTLAVGSPLAPSRHARQRRRWASAIRSRPACVFGPVDNPPWKRQRAFPRSTLTKQVPPARLIAPHRGRCLRLGPQADRSD